MASGSSRAIARTRDPCLRLTTAACSSPAPGVAQHLFDLHTLLTQSGIALAVMAALAFALGWLVAGRVLRPVRSITAAARRMSATSLHERLTVTGPNDEFSELAGTLNDLLARLEARSPRSAISSPPRPTSCAPRSPSTAPCVQVALRNPARPASSGGPPAWRSSKSGRHQERLLEALLTLATSEGGLSGREPADLSEAAAASLRAAA